MKFLKRLFCFHYFEDNATNPEDFPRKLLKDYENTTGMFMQKRKAVICNKCGKIKVVDYDYLDVKYIGK